MCYIGDWIQFNIYMLHFSGCAAPGYALFMNYWRLSIIYFNNVLFLLICSYPGVNTEVSYFINWINDKIAGL